MVRMRALFCTAVLVGLLSILLFQPLAAHAAKTGRDLPGVPVDSPMPLHGMKDYPPGPSAPTSDVLTLPHWQGWAISVGMGHTFGVTDATDAGALAWEESGAVFRSLSSGEQIWTSPHITPVLLSSRYVVGNDDGGVTALDATTGKKLWSRAGMEALGYSGNSVWVRHSKVLPDKGFPEYTDLLLVDIQSGKERTIAKGAFKNYFQSPRAADSPEFVVQTADAVICYAASGELWRRPAPPKQRDVQAVTTERGILVAEYLNFEDDDTAESKYWDDLEQVAQQRKSTGQLARFDLYLLDSHTGDMLWHVQPTYGFSAYDGLYVSGPIAEVAGDHLILLRDASLAYEDNNSSSYIYDEFSLSTGGFERRLYDGGEYLLMGETFAKDGWYYGQQRLGENRVAVVRANLDTGEHQSIEFTGFPYFQFAIGGNYLVVGGEKESGSTQLAPTGVLIGLPFDSDFKPTPGELIATGFKTPDLSPAGVIDDESVDIATAADILAQGDAAAFATLVDRYADLSPRQREIVYRAALAGRDMWAEEMPELGRNLETDVMYRFTNEADVPWLIKVDEELHGGLARLIGVGGGPLAAKYLAGQGDRFPQNETLSPVQPPYTWTEYSSSNGPTAMKIDSAVQIGGESYSVLEHNGLVGPEIYLGRISSSGNSYDAIWPTGLTNVMGMSFLPGGYEGLEKPIGPLTLRAEGDNLFIKHHEPILGPNLNVPNVQDIVSAKYVESSTTLAAVTRDTDGDGLTDIAEDLLMLDAGKKDSDGDGIDDAQDSCPNVDLSHPGYLARGVLRAFGSSGSSAALEPCDFPFDTRYFVLEGEAMEPIALPQGGCTRSICIYTPQMHKRYDEAANHGNQWNSIFISVSRITNGKLPKDSMLAQDDDVVHRGDYLVEFSYPGSGSSVELKDVGGELYPIADGPGWISERGLTPRGAARTITALR